MTTMNMWTYSESDLTALANQAKEQIIFALGKEGLLKSDPEEIAREYVIVMYKKGWFGRQWDKWRGMEKDGSYFAVLKNVNSSAPRDDEETEEATVTHLKAVPKQKDD